MNGTESWRGTRRNFVKAAILTGTGLSLERLNRPITPVERILLAQELYGHEFRTSPQVTSPAIYPLEVAQSEKEVRVRDTLTITLGDSIARGYYDTKQPEYPAIDLVVQTVNKLWPGTMWKEAMLAEAWATTDTIIEKQLPKAKELIQGHEHVNVNIAAVGNDIAIKLMYYAQMIQDLESVSEQRLNPAWVDLCRVAISTIEQVPSILMPLLQAIQTQDPGHHIEKMFIQSLPNFSKTDHITYKDLTIPIKGRVFKRVAGNVSFLINLYLKRAVEKAGGNIYLKNNFDLLQQGQLASVHPNKEGQTAMAENYLMGLKGKDVKTGRIYALSDPKAVDLAKWDMLKRAA